MASEKKSSAADLEWERRVLCSDESCIGVIGPDGRCKECGLVYEGELPRFAAEAPDLEDPETKEGVVHPGDDDDNDFSDDLDDGEDTDGAPGDDEWERRVLCSDESCIGVIGPDGLCKECGKPLRQN